MAARPSLKRDLNRWWDRYQISFGAAKRRGLSLEDAAVEAKRTATEETGNRVEDLTETLMQQWRPGRSRSRR